MSPRQRPATRASRRPPAPGDAPQVLIGGRRPALEAIRSGGAQELLVAGSARANESLREVLEAARRSGVPTRSTDTATLDDLLPDIPHQGVGVRVAVIRPLTEQDLAHRDWPADALVLVLDGVEDPHNVGAAARSAEAAGASALVLRTRRGAQVTAAAVKASAGAFAHLPVAAVANITRALDRLRGAGFWIVGLDGDAEQAIGDGDPPPGPLALVVGSEGAGLSRLVRESCDELLAIPLRGRVGSLNVSVAAGVALFGYGMRRTPMTTPPRGGGTKKKG